MILDMDDLCRRHRMHPRLRHVQQVAADGGSCRHPTKRRYCFVRTLSRKLRRKQFGWRNMPERIHPDPHLHGKCPGAVWFQIAAIYSSLEEASLYSLLDLYHLTGMTCFYHGGMCHHPAAKPPPFRQRPPCHQSGDSRCDRLRCPSPPGSAGSSQTATDLFHRR